MRISLGCPQPHCTGLLNADGYCETCGLNGAGVPTTKIETDNSNQQTQTSDNQNTDEDGNC